MFFAFGLLVIGIVAYLAVILAIPIGLTLYYAFSLQGHGFQQEFRAGLFFTMWFFSMVVVLFFLLVGVDGNAGSGVTIWGVGIGEGWTEFSVFLVSAGIVVLGQKKMKEKQKRWEEAADEDEDEVEQDID